MLLGHNIQVLPLSTFSDGFAEETKAFTMNHLLPVVEPRCKIFFNSGTRDEESSHEQCAHYYLDRKNGSRKTTMEPFP